jgi:hypothetical protein
MKKKFRIVSMLLTVVLLMSAFVTPVAAGQGNGRGQERQNEQQIQYIDAEVQVIDGQPVIKVEARDGNATHIPVQLPGTILVDSQIVPLVVRNGAVVIPTEDGPVAVPVPDFDVVVVDGQVALITEVNPAPIIKLIAKGIVTGAAANIGSRIIDAIWPRP